MEHTDKYQYVSDDGQHIVRVSQLKHIIVEISEPGKLTSVLAEKAELLDGKLKIRRIGGEVQTIKLSNAIVTFSLEVGLTDESVRSSRTTRRREVLLPEE